ncbi:MAG TPA: family 78 glycoside hydrolase catalytic domain [Candidatus Hydrogenedentes bacterium]|nr:family 78 glycoside hydrolase catalytic domain [Candidatus Hydrogenedentota bacterium]
MATTFCADAGAQAGVSDLRCEFLHNPLGIDAAQPRLSWILPLDKPGQRQTAYQVLVGSREDLLAEGKADLWDSGKVASDQSSLVVYAGKPLASKMRCFWKVQVWDKDGQAWPWSETAFWTMGLLAPEDWKGQWIGADWMKDNAGPLPWLRKTITLNEKPRRAMAYVCALGYYELYVNGEKVDDYVLCPAVSEYGKRGLYVTHDVSKYLTAGENCIGIWLGRGWSVQSLSKASQSGPLVKAQFEMESDAGNVTVVTDETWKAHASNITPLGKGDSGDYGGESVDARAYLENWNKLGLDETDWSAVKVSTPPTPIVAAMMMEPNRIIGSINPVSITPHDKEFLVDMGKNYSGWFEMRFPASMPAGQKIEIQFADKQFPDGKFQFYNQRDEYITKGGGESFKSRFNYHSFRWALIKGLSEAPKAEDITGLPISTDYAPAAEFACSNELLNKVYQTMLWTYRCLSLSGYTVDCPHRERLGYGGDSGTSMEMAMTNFKTATFYNKWVDDWRDAQNEEGDVPFTAPHHDAGGGPVWSGFCVTMPWQVYVEFGDKRILEQSYPEMVKWLAFVDTKFKDGILQFYVSIGCKDPHWNFLGDWVPPGRKQGQGRVDDRSTLFFNNCYYVFCLQLASKIAYVLDKPAEGEVYARKAQELAQRLQEQFYEPAKASYANGEQPYLAIPLLFNIVPEPLRDKVMANLEHDITVTQKGHLNTGMHGTYYMIKYFIAQGRNDLVYTIMSKDTYPSYGYMLKNGATTIWEEWDSDNSQIHNTLISAGLWFIQGLGGIRYDEQKPGFKHIILSPGVVDELSFAKASYDSPYGKISSHWAKEGDSVTYDLEIPANTTATVILPAKSAEAVRENGKPISPREDITDLQAKNGKVQFMAAPGQYKFDVSSK